MKKQYYYDKIKKMIKQSYAKRAFMISDLKTGASYECTKKSLQRLEKQGLIKRATRGVYYKPIYSKALKQYLEPNYEVILMTLARNYGWKILPSKLNVLNAIGLDTQVSNKIDYITSGPNKTIDIKGLKIHLYHSNDNFIFNCSTPTMLFVQAIKGICLNKITNNQIKKLNLFFSKEQKQTILNEIKFYKKPFINIANEMMRIN